MDDAKPPDVYKWYKYCQQRIPVANSKKHKGFECGISVDYIVLLRPV